MNDKRVRTVPCIDEIVETQHMLFTRKDVAFHRGNDVAYANEEMAVCGDGRGALNRRLGIDEGNDMACTGRSDRFVQAGQG
jgi:hypothetical protein